MAKGGVYEREVSRSLSKWWTYGVRDDVFWRDPVRGRTPKAGSKFFGQYGDIMAVDKLGSPLLELCVVECKKGYNRSAPSDALDKLPRKGKYLPTQWEQFVAKAQTDADAAGVNWWLLIFKRDRRRAMIYFPRAVGEHLLNAHPESWVLNPWGCQSMDGLTVYFTPLDEFFDKVSPAMFQHGSNRNRSIKRIWKP